MPLQRPRKEAKARKVEPMITACIAIEDVNDAGSVTTFPTDCAS
jgi:hypothetical protein